MRTITQPLAIALIAAATPWVSLAPAQARHISFDDGPGVDLPINDFYASLGATFSNAAWTDRFNGRPGTTPPLQMTNDTQGAKNMPKSDTPIVVVFDQNVALVSIWGNDVGFNDVRVDAYDAPAGGNLLGSSTYEGVSELGNTLLPPDAGVISVCSPGIRRIELYQPESGTPTDGASFDDLRFMIDSTVGTYCTAKPGLVCGIPAMGGTGCPSASSTSGLELFAEPAARNKSGVLLYGAAGRAAIPFQGGTLCVAPSLFRSVAVNSGGQGPCDGRFSIDMNAFAAGVLGGSPAAFVSQPATQINCQFWGRDSLATGSFLSDGAEYVIGL